MTVRELLARLERAPQDATVTISNGVSTNLAKGLKAITSDIVCLYDGETIPMTQAKFTAGGLDGYKVPTTMLDLYDCIEESDKGDACAHWNVMLPGIGDVRVWVESERFYDRENGESHDSLRYVITEQDENEEEQQLFATNSPEQLLIWLNWRFQNTGPRTLSIFRRLFSMHSSPEGRSEILKSLKARTHTDWWDLMNQKEVLQNLGHAWHLIAEPIPSDECDHDPTNTYDCIVSCIIVPESEAALAIWRDVIRIWTGQEGYEM